MKQIEKKDHDFIVQAFSGTKKFDYSIRHALDTAFYFEKTAKRFSEVPAKKIEKLFFASLGHDLLEDTKVTPAMIEKIWGKQVLKYIKDLTNAEGDKNFTIYLDRLKKSPEEIVLVKLADIQANIVNSINYFSELKISWIKNFWLPLLSKYEQALFGREFKKYPMTAGMMISQNKRRIRSLHKIVKNH